MKIGTTSCRTVYAVAEGFFSHPLRLICCFTLLFSGLVSSSGKEKTAESPRFSPIGGIYATNVVAQLSARAGVVHYTLDGSDPGENSPVYSTPLQITNSTLVRARAFTKASQPSAAAAEVYTLLDNDALDFSSNLPLIIINSFGSNIVHDMSVGGSVQFIDPGKGRAQLVSAPDLSRSCLVHVRGRASLRYPKNSFTVKVTDGEGDPEKVSALGFPAESDWVLYAPYPDKTLMRDVLAYELHRQMGHWAPRTRFVEVFVNRTGTKLGRQDYAGIYVFEEKIKRGKDRVNIAKLKPDDKSEPRITGGYIFKKDHVGDANPEVAGDPLGGFPAYRGSGSGNRIGYPTGPGGFPADPKGFQPPLTPGGRIVSSSSSSTRISRLSRGVVTNYLGRGPVRDFASINQEIIYTSSDEGPMPAGDISFRTARTNHFYYIEPQADEITAVQKSWLRNYLNEFEEALSGPNFKDPVKGYAAYLDVDSLIDYHLMVETTKNVDGFRFSVFFHKDRGGKLRSDPIWDWNLSFGCADGKQGWMPEYWLWPQLDDHEYTWYRRLFEDPDFGQRYVDRWCQLRTNVFATSNILARVDQIKALLQESQKRNFERWPILGRPVNPNYFVFSTYEEEVGWLKKYLQSRLDWIEKQFVPGPKLSLEAGQKAELLAANGEIYFTLDGSDPRASGGSPSPSARLYEAPFVVGKKSRLFARARVDGRWSGPLVYP